MEKLLSRLNKKSLTLLRQIGRLAEAQGAHAYLVGGSVRDLILKRLVKDLDIVIVGDAVVLAKKFASSHKARVVAYTEFKTASVFLSDGSCIDFASCRLESYVRPGSLPLVRFAGIQEDLARRDFTVNAMALSIVPLSWGELLDPFEGIRDLKFKKIRVLHDQSFIDDPTRLLRAIRFEQRLGCSLESKTLQLFKDALVKKAIHTVKPQRYFEEFKKVLSEVDANACILRLVHLGGLYIHALSLNLESSALLKLNFVKEAVEFYQKKGIVDFQQWLVYLMLLQDESRVEDLLFALELLGVSRKDKDSIVSSVASEALLAKLAASTIKSSQVFSLLHARSLEAVVYFRAMASVKAQSRIDDYMFKYRHVSLKINGNDLKKIGVPQGSKMKIILEKTLLALIDGEIKTKQEEIKFAKNLL